MECGISQPQKFVGNRCSGVKKTCSPEGRIKRTNGPHYNNNHPTNASAALQRYILEASIRTLVVATLVTFWFMGNKSPLSWFSEDRKLHRQNIQYGVYSGIYVSWRGPREGVAVKPLVLDCIYVKQRPVASGLVRYGLIRFFNAASHINDEKDCLDLFTSHNGPCMSL